MSRTTGTHTAGRLRSSGRRAAALAAVAVLVAAGAALDQLAARPGPRTTLQPSALAAAAAPPGAQSSAWYCTGGSGAPDSVAPTRLLIVNAGNQAVSGSLRVVDATGGSGHATFHVPPHAQVSEVPGNVVDGAWLATRVEAHGGAVTVAELVSGAAGWSAAPCASAKSPRWYFPTGSTATGSSLRISLFDPGANLAVVDLSFITQGGEVTPAPFQGLVVRAGAVTTVTVGTYVQDRPAVATVVDARSGAVVATELQIVSASGVSGLSLKLGAPATSTSWVLPGASDPSGGSSSLTVFNPADSAAHVKVTVHLASGPATPFTQVVAPTSLWTLSTATQLRVPPGTDYAAEVAVTGKTGVVVGREVAGASSAPAPQWGASPALPAPAFMARHWVVPAVGSLPGGAGPLALALENPGAKAATVTIDAFARTGVENVAHIRLAAGAVQVVQTRARPLVVRSSGPVAVSGTGSGNGAPGVVSIPAVPQPQS